MSGFAAGDAGDSVDMKHKMHIISIITMCLLVGCGHNNIEQNDSEIQDSSTFAEYSGDWSYEGKTQEQVLAEGGGELSCTVTADNGSDNASWTEEEMIKAINERSQYYKASAYYSEIIDYWENIREVRDISNVIEPLFETDKKYYTKEDFESEPMLVIHLAKNEIYARHGYTFANKDLHNYFMGCIWYSPTCDSANFDDSIFNEYESANLDILADLDTY